MSHNEKRHVLDLKVHLLKCLIPRFGITGTGAYPGTNFTPLQFFGLFLWGKYLILYNWLKVHAYLSVSKKSIETHSLSFSETVVAESVVVIKKLLQTQPLQHSDIIKHMAKLFDSITVRLLQHVYTRTGTHSIHARKTLLGLILPNINTVIFAILQYS